MELIRQVKGNYSDGREDEEDEEEAVEIITATREAESSSSSRLHQQQDGASKFGKQLELMELRLGSNKEEGEEGTKAEVAVEKEHMFDKVVTPSDVGKLNRLVIPKQHAEKYFPLDSSSNEKGLLLNFEDRNGKLWRFRYSYWNSSQSYVMTKGWSRFVKEKKLDAGDIVSFQRGRGDLYRERLFIDWRRRSDHPHAPPDPPFFLPNIRWYSLPQTTMPPHHHFHHPNPNYNSFHHLGSTAALHANYFDHNSGSASLYYLRNSLSTAADIPNMQRRGHNVAPLIIDSVPVNIHHRHAYGMPTTGPAADAIANTSGGKRLRLFGVNMECASPADSKTLSPGSAAHVSNLDPPPPPPSSLQRLRMPLPLHEEPLSLSAARFGDHHKGGTSVLFDLEPSFHYRK
ncbi:hypothetical protein Fmac_007254 [Flemingia macrophylla]|uniref:TF-B3 domain-containing protein n=1 Tax=Flemingia macrophylla TaxID=520843 RepID=A0ABD1NCX5_9FABA